MPLSITLKAKRFQNVCSFLQPYGLGLFKRRPGIAVLSIGHLPLYHKPFGGHIPRAFLSLLHYVNKVSWRMVNRMVQLYNNVIKNSEHTKSFQ